MADETKISVKDFFMRYYEIGNGGESKKLSAATATIIFNEYGYGKQIKCGDKTIDLRTIEITSFLRI